MRILTVGIKNFRCLHDTEVEFDELTAFVGPNGAGKSSVLRALDWFFNGDKSSMSSDDIYAGADDGDKLIRVRVTFGDLTAKDREALGPKYAPPRATTFTVWRTWDDGAEKVTGKAFAYGPFENIRAGDSATEKKARWNELKAAEPGLGMPSWTTGPAAEAWMGEWEAANPAELAEAEVSGTHFFGFNSQGKLSGLFDFVLVTADLRAGEESADGKSTILGRIL